MAASKPRIKAPKTAKAGETIVIKTLINHEMESGQRKDKDGKAIQRKIINKFSCSFEGQEIFSCDIDPAVSANPYFEFNAKLPKSGTLKFAWVDDDGTIFSEEQRIEVA